MADKPAGVRPDRQIVKNGHFQQPVARLAEGERLGRRVFDERDADRAVSRHIVAAGWVEPEGIVGIEDHGHGRPRRHDVWHRSDPPVESVRPVVWAGCLVAVPPDMGEEIPLRNRQIGLGHDRRAIRIANGIAGVARRRLGRPNMANMIRAPGAAAAISPAACASLGPCPAVAQSAPALFPPPPPPPAPPPPPPPPLPPPPLPVPHVDTFGGGGGVGVSQLTYRIDAGLSLMVDSLLIDRPLVSFRNQHRVVSAARASRSRGFHRVCPLPGGSFDLSNTPRPRPRILPACRVPG